MAENSRKRKADDAESDTASKKAKMDDKHTASTLPTPANPEAVIAEPAPEDGEQIQDEEETPETVEESEKKKGKRRADAAGLDKPTPGVKYRKLAPPRPFPTVPTSVSATGPRSAHVEGKNYICVTRKTPLAMYLRRCKGAVLNDGCVACYDLQLQLTDVCAQT